MGRLTVLAPNITIIHDQKIKHKRFVHQFESDCKDKINFWGKGKGIAASILTIGVTAAKALKMLKNLRCWLSRQTNATSQALNEPLANVNIIKHNHLQNRATSPRVHCEDFEGMCCMNLSNHSESIHQNIQILKERLKKSQKEDDNN